ncbi:MAG: GspE/PulE family protein [Candidatus Kuenenbacteria bacterium]
MLPIEIFKKIIEKEKITSKEKLLEIEKEIKGKNIVLEEYFLSKGIIDEDSFYEKASFYLEIPFINLKKQIIPYDVLILISEPIAQTYKIISFKKEKEVLKIATIDPQNLQIFEFIKRKIDLPLEIYLATPSGIKKALQQYHVGLKAELTKITKEESGVELQKIGSDLPIIKIVDTLIEYAIFQNASDIHIEPAEKEVNIRYRIDGILKDIMSLPKNIQVGIIARIKILSNLKLDEHRLPQDGRFKVSSVDYKISFRVSVLPTFHGEKIVLRLLSESSKVLSLEQLVFQPEVLSIVKKNIKKPHGIIFVTGPTGSGKTTTLYTIMNILNTPQVNISTIEDPIEYHMPRINQSQVAPKIGFTFAKALRALLRQDPNIIMVGEIRDQETAEIATHAAMTGHLVLSTLHTNDAISSLPRLIDMGVPAFLVVGTCNLIIAQRLVRKICKYCAQKYKLSKEQIEEFKKEFNLDSITEILIKKYKIAEGQDLSLVSFYKGKGCRQCDNNGYKGRLGIFEVLEMTPELSDLIMRKATIEQIKKFTQKQKMITMIEDGFIKALDGITTIEEIIRVTKE